MKKNRILAFVMVFIMCLFVLNGCGTDGTNKNEGKISIVCTTYPQYDWIREIVGEQSDSFDLIFLLDNGVDLHSYQPTAEDVAKIASADMFVYVGGESDGWVKDALKEATNKDMKVVNMLEVLGDTVKEEEVVEGMQEEEHADEEHQEEEKEYDEHVWLSIGNAVKLTEILSQNIQELDEKHAAVYDANTKEYVKKLEKLDQEYAETVQAGSQRTVLFGDRFPFRYLVDDYDLNYYAAFVGCSAETEASFETITFLAGKIDELGLKTILVIDSSDQKIANTIKENTSGKDQSILVMNSLQCITEDDKNGNTGYLQVMEDNRKVLEKALQ